MEGMVYECQCGHVFTEPEIDLKAKKAVCKKCRSVVNLRERLNSSEEVVGNGKAAVTAFLERDWDRAYSAAKHVLNVCDDNIPALFINAYYNAFAADKKKDLPLKTFFEKEFLEVDPLPEEVDMFKKIIVADTLRIAMYEEVILKRMSELLDDKELGEFTEEFSPKTILNRKSIDWFTPGMIETYSNIAKRAVTAKTWFALYKGVGENPDSPEKTETLRNPRMIERFYNNYVLGVEKIYNSIADAEQKTKFTTAFAARIEKYKKLM